MHVVVYSYGLPTHKPKLAICFTLAIFGTVSNIVGDGYKILYASGTPGSAVRSPTTVIPLQQSKKIEFHMPTELAPSHPMATNQERVTVTYMAKRERR